MKYKIEIWQYFNMTEFFESDNIQDILDWYKENWWGCYEIGGCSFTIYENDRELSFEEEYELGFY